MFETIYDYNKFCNEQPSQNKWKQCSLYTPTENQRPTTIVDHWLIDSLLIIFQQLLQIWFTWSLIWWLLTVAVIEVTC